MNLKKTFLILSLSVLFFNFGCATSNSAKSAESTSMTDEDESSEGSTQVPVVTQGEELEVIPIEINDNVRMWIKYFQGRGRPHMERYLARSTRYEALMKKVLRDNKLPEDLFYIALIESGFSPRAYSHASAVGYWQFIRGTGKRYKLKIDRMIDERRDPMLATQAAANYFKDLYGIFNSWYLSMAAYNVGEGRVIKAVKKYKTNDFWELSKNKRALPKETDNYVPKYIAAKLIAKNPDKYGFDGIDYMPPIEFDNVTFSQPVNLRVLAEKMNINYEDFKDLNPKFKGEIAPLGNNNQLELRIPINTQEVALKSFQDSVASSTDFIPDQDETQVYIVRRGDTFSSVARRFKTNIAYLREINDFPRKKKLRVGQRIFVPDRTPLKDKKAVIEKVAADGSGQKFHIVRPGETLASIAQKYKVSVAELLKMNKMDRKNTLKTGKKLKLPEEAVVQEMKSSKLNPKTKRSVASAADKKSNKKTEKKTVKKKKP